jgi:predicted Fe-Mo cluster-binding NifX family protein
MVAIPSFGDRVSPRFDCAQVIKIVTFTDGRETKSLEVSASEWTSRVRVRRLIELGVDRVICGGIDTLSANALKSAGIAVDGCIRGSVDDALKEVMRREREAGEDRRDESATSKDTRP